MGRIVSMPYSEVIRVAFDEKETYARCLYCTWHTYNMGGSTGADDFWFAVDAHEQKHIEGGPNL